MNVRHIIHDQTFKKFLVGLVVLVGLTGLGIYSAKNILPEVNDKIAKTNSGEVGKPSISGTPNNPPKDSTKDSDGNSQSDSTKDSSAPGVGFPGERTGTGAQTDTDSLPLTGNSGVVDQAVALGIVTFGFVHIVQQRNRF